MSVTRTRKRTTLRTTGGGFRDWREAHGWTREEVAVMLEVNYSTICRAEQKEDVFITRRLQRKLDSISRRGASVEVILTVKSLPEKVAANAA
jgi:transcriptional regulator with XRE-family HTH domain